MLVPETVTGPTLPSDALLASTRVSDSDAPLHALGIEASAMLVTTLAVTVHEIDMPESEPHDVTVALAPTTVAVLAVAPAANAVLGMTSITAPAMASTESRRCMA
jgi:hypothetical protein